MELTEKKEFDLLSLGEIMLRLSPPDNERITRGDSFSKQAGGAELNLSLIHISEPTRH